MLDRYQGSLMGLAVGDALLKTARCSRLYGQLAVVYCGKVIGGKG